jgi:DNA-binding PadR family transcriptional regulator
MRSSGKLYRTNCSHALCKTGTKCLNALSVLGEILEFGFLQYFCCRYIRDGYIVATMASGFDAGAPLSPAVLAILLSLAEGEKHGYAMMKDARSVRGGGIAMGPGTLYGSIERMMRDGLVVESEKQDDERRRYYRLTGMGRTVLATELKRLDATVAAARKMGLLPQGGRS